MFVFRFSTVSPVDEAHNLLWQFERCLKQAAGPKQAKHRERAEWVQCRRPRCSLYKLKIRQYDRDSFSLSRTQHLGAKYCCTEYTYDINVNTICTHFQQRSLFAVPTGGLWSVGKCIIHKMRAMDLPAPVAGFLPRDFCWIQARV